VVDSFTFFFSTMNCLDFVVVVVPLIGEILRLVNLDVKLSVLQGLRLVRLVRVVRVVRFVQFLKELTVMLQVFADAVHPMLSFAGLFWLIAFAFSVCVVAMVGEDDTTYPAYDVDRMSPYIENYNPYTYFGTLGTAMYTLFTLFTLSDVREIARPLLHHRPALFFIVCAYIVFTSYGLANIIVGVVVDATLRRKRELERFQQKMALDLKIQFLKRLKVLMQQLDEDGSGTLGQDEMRKGLEIPEVRQILSNMKVPSHFSASDIVTLLDNTGSGSITEDEFLTGFYRLTEDDPFTDQCLVQCSLNHIKRLALHTTVMSEAICDVTNIDVSEIDRQLNDAGDKEHTSVLDALVTAAQHTKRMAMGGHAHQPHSSHWKPAKPQKKVRVAQTIDENEEAAAALRVDQGIEEMQQEVEKLQAEFRELLNASVKKVVRQVSDGINDIVQQHTVEMMHHLHEQLQALEKRQKQVARHEKHMMLAVIHAHMERQLEVARASAESGDVQVSVNEFAAWGHRLSLALGFKNRKELLTDKFESTEPDAYYQHQMAQSKPQRATGLALITGKNMCS